MSTKILFYFLSLIPFLTRFAMVLFSSPVRKSMKRSLETAERDSEAHRTLILALAGFSFSALLAVVVVDATTTSGTRPDFHLTVFYLLISFLCYLVALNLQGYKFWGWQDWLSDALIEAASLSLLASVIALLWGSQYSLTIKVVCTVLATMAWSVDHVVRLRLMWKYLSHGVDQCKIKIETTTTKYGLSTLTDAQSTMSQPHPESSVPNVPRGSKSGKRRSK